MSEKIIEKRKGLAEVARQIDKLASEALVQFEGAGEFEKELVVAQAMVDMRVLLTPEIMAPIMALMNTDIGFNTDRDPKKPSKGQTPTPYTPEVVRECFIESRLRGFHAVGNEWNIIAGRFYGCKNGFERKVRELTQGSCEISIDPPQMQGGQARVKCRASWKYKGEVGNMGVRPEDPCEFMVRINEYMGPDGAIGKAQRKLCQRIFQRLSGRNVPDGDASDVIDVAATATAQPATNGAKKHEFEAADMAAKADKPAEPQREELFQQPAQPAEDATKKAKEREVQNLSPQAKLELYMGENGVTLDKFRWWCEQTERIEDVMAIPGWPDLPTKFCEDLIKDAKALSKCVTRCKS